MNGVHSRVQKAFGPWKMLTLERSLKASDT